MQFVALRLIVIVAVAMGGERRESALVALVSSVDGGGSLSGCHALSDDVEG